MKIKRIHLLISGEVQGIGFRSFIKWNAKKLNLTGLGKNLEDGRVEAVLEGEEKNLQEMIKRCKEGPPLAEVEDVEVFWEEANNEFNDFEVRQ